MRLADVSTDCGTSTNFLRGHFCPPMALPMTYTVVPKTCHFYFCNNFGKCGPILITLCSYTLLYYWLYWCVRRTFLCMYTYIQGKPKSNPLGKIRYLWNRSKFFRQIYSFFRGGFRPYILQISLKYLVAFKNYNYLNLNMHFSKWTSN